MRERFQSKNYLHPLTDIKSTIAILLNATNANQSKSKDILPTQAINKINQKSQANQQISNLIKLTPKARMKLCQIHLKTKKVTVRNNNSRDSLTAIVSSYKISLRKALSTIIFLNKNTKNLKISYFCKFQVLNINL